MKKALFWFRRDLRLDDNAGLYQALKSGMPVLPVFVFDTGILLKLNDKKDKRVDIIHQRIRYLNTVLNKRNSALCVRFGRPAEVIPQLCNEFDVAQVYCNEDYEPEAIRRDREVANQLRAMSVGFSTYKDQVIFAKNEVMKPDGTPYTVFTPYSKKWKALLDERKIEFYPSENELSALLKFENETTISLADIGFETAGINLHKPDLTDNILLHYAETRNFPAIDNGTSHSSVSLRFGMVSVRNLVFRALPLSEAFLNELIWREFFMMILYHFPQVVTSAFKPAYDNIKWRNNQDEFERWCTGQTGYPLVDAGMRELNATGLMHNRVRMVTASFLVKHLLIDWRWGEAYFAEKLLDYDLSANNGNWQWAAGSGCDAAPYFRVFNPAEQIRKFDAALTYVRKWVPEFESPDYTPVVEHTFARNRILEVYKKALQDDI